MILRQATRILFQLIPGSDLRHLIKHKPLDGLAPRFVTPKCDLVIDGFPRSANTWIYYNVQIAFPEARIAHHVHSWQQFLLARFYGIPSFLILREPDACVQSLVTKQGGAMTLHYLDYLMTAGLGAIFADKVYLFGDLTFDRGIERLNGDIAKVLNTEASTYSQSQVEEIMENRTKFKNVKTPPFKEGDLGVISGVIRVLANNLYIRLKKRSRIRMY